MRDIQIDGAPMATPRPASTSRTRRRVMGTGRDHKGSANGIRRYMACAGPAWNCGKPDFVAIDREISNSPENYSIINLLLLVGRIWTVHRSLTFGPFGAESHKENIYKGSSLPKRDAK